MEFQEFTGKTLNDAVTNALIGLETTRENLEYEIVDKGSNGFLGMGARLARIKAKRKEEPKKTVEEIIVKSFLSHISCSNILI